VAAAGTVLFGIFNQVDNVRVALLFSGFLFIPAALVAMMLPDEQAELPEPELASR
jgi:hypothetical protein